MAVAVSCAVGVVAGSLLLARLSTDLLMAGVGMGVLLYIGLRIARPSWRLDRERGVAFAKPVGLVAGPMQGAGGISAPVSVTYLNALRLERTEFVGTIALFFVGMAVLQVPSLVVLGLLDWERFGLGLLAAIPLFGAMPLGAALGRRISREAFDRIVLVLLAAVSLRLMYVALS